MRLSSLYPVIATDRVAETAAFYTDLFGFETTFAADWYVSLRRTEAPHQELAILRYDHPTVPEGFRRRVSGVLLNFEVDDVDAQWSRLVERAGLEAHLAIRTEEFGQRHFIVSDPAGTLIDVITEVPPGDGYAANFVG
ncbi:VOC family protein [Actinomadura flavalba]|uniref:VOC family protein n=1 Tax=Actinomadura flavalba TaxID=1120938 RepID=UPI0003A047E3|nr:VOC family protein [Actinomadura flavalba]